jgi:hypothetical protein
MGEVFIGSEAVAAGRLTRHELKRWHRPIYRGVYGQKQAQPSLHDRIYAAWLASDRNGVVAGVAASALHGAAWIDEDIPIELICRLRPQTGLVIRKDTLPHDEITKVAGIPVTTRARAAFDLGRRLERGEAVARLDALMRASPFAQGDVLMLAKRYRGARGLRTLQAILPLVDGGAASPRESWLRLIYIDAGLPRPTTQIPIVGPWAARPNVGHGMGGIHGGVRVRRGASPNQPPAVRQGHQIAAQGQESRLDCRSSGQGGP